MTMNNYDNTLSSVRLSSHTVILPIIKANNETDSEHRLLFNGLYMAFDVVPANVADALSNGSTALENTVLKRLLRRGHLTAMSEEGEIGELKFITRLKRLLDKKHFYAEIIPTYSCNFRCPYCFESRRLKNGEEWLSKRISPELLDAYFKVLMKYRERGIKIEQLNLYGGEPLLKENHDLIENICRRCKELDIPVETITNGYDIDHYIDLIDKYHWRDIQISIDGYGELTDKLRRHKDGNATYEKIMQNVKLLYDHNIKTSLRVMTDRKRLSGLGRVAEDIRRRGLEEKAGLFGYYVTSVVSADKDIMVSPMEIYEQLVSSGMTEDQARSHVLQLRRAWSAVRINMNMKSLIPVFPYRCRAHNSQRLSVDPYGKVFTCFRAVGEPNASVGIINTENARFEPNVNALLWDQRDVGTLKKCRTCAFAMFCGGGCSERAKAVKGNFFSEECGQTKEIYSYILPRAVGKLWHKGMSEELSLSWAEFISKIPAKEKEQFMQAASLAQQQKIIKDCNWAKLFGGFV